MEQKSSELNALVAVAEDIDGATKEAGPEGVQEQRQMTEQDALMAENAKGIMLILDLAGPAFAMVGFKSVAGVLDQKQEAGGPMARQVLAMAWAPVLSKYGINLSDIGMKYGVELAAIAATFPIAGAIFAGIKGDIAARDAVPKALGTAAQAAPVAAPAGTAAAQAVGALAPVNLE